MKWEKKTPCHVTILEASDDISWEIHIYERHTKSWYYVVIGAFFKMKYHNRNFRIWLRVIRQKIIENSIQELANVSWWLLQLEMMYAHMTVWAWICLLRNSVCAFAFPMFVHTLLWMCTAMHSGIQSHVCKHSMLAWMKRLHIIYFTLVECIASSLTR